MKKRYIWISVAIVAAAGLLLFLSLQKKGRLQIDAGGAVATLRLSNSWLNKTTVSSGARASKVSARIHRPQWLKLSKQQGSDTWQL